jgi:hypothetical protein
MWLELLLYGEVQHRVVDDIIGVFIFYLMYSNVKYKLIDKFITK